MTRYLSSLLLFFLLIAGLNTSAQNNCNLKIGTNLAGPADYGSEWPFVDIFKYSRTWVTHNEPSWTGGVSWSPWDTQLQDSIPLDANGYPTHVPFDVIGADTAQVVRTVWANTGQLPSGVYVLLYDGEGVIDFTTDGQIISQQPGRIEVQVTGGPSAAGIMGMEIFQSTYGNHVRNIRFLMPNTELTYQTQPWAQEWLDKLEPFSALRFMDWGYTNNSTLRNWADRPQVNDATYTVDGVPYEWMIDICNTKQADAWVCVPHLASDDYITQMATLFRDEMLPDQKIYVEYSNELWNWIFWQAHYGNDSLDQNLSWPERLAPRIGHVMSIWDNVFQNQPERIVCVLATQHAWFDIGDRIYQQMEAEGTDHLIDAISPAAYMGLNHEPLAALGANATAADAVLNAQDFTFDTAEYAMQGWYAHAQLAQQKGKKLVYYEGGQHFTPEPWGTVQPYNPALMAAQADPLMYGLYQQLFDSLAAFTQDETVLMHFSFISPLWEDPNNGAYGNFGSLTSQFYQSEPYTDAPKYRALRDHIAACNVGTGLVHQADPSIALALYLYPNPATTTVRIQLPQGTQRPTQTFVYDMTGRLVHQQPFTTDMDVSTLSRGTYAIVVYTEQGNYRGMIQKQ